MKKNFYYYDNSLREDLRNVNKLSSISDIIIN